MISLTVLSLLLPNKMTSNYLVVAGFLKLFVLVDTLISNVIIYEVKSGFIFSIDQSVMRLSNLEELKTEHTSRAVDQLTGQNT